MKDPDIKESILIWFKISGLYNRNIKETIEILKEHNLTLGQFDVLAHLGTSSEMTQNELSEKLLVSKGSTSQILATMESEGWVQRRQEWKTKYVSLTASGEALRDKVVPILESYQRKMFAVLQEEERSAFLSMLRKIEGASHPV